MTDTIEIPRDAHELEALLRDPAKMQQVVGSPEKLTSLITNYAQTVMQKNTDIATTIRTEVDRVLGQMMRDNLPLDSNGEPIKGAGIRVPLDMSQLPDGAFTPMPGSIGMAHARRQGLFAPRAMGSAINNEFTDVAAFFQGIWHNTRHDAAGVAKMMRIKNAFSSTVPSEGGFLIPETLRSELLRVSLESSIVRQRARVIPMETLRVPIPMIDSTSNVSSVYGGIVAYWTEEGASLTNTSASFGRVVLDAKKLTAYTEVPNELLSDTISSFEAFINMMFPEALAFYEDDAYINGSGVGEPLGFLDAANGARILVAKETGQDADTIVWENIIKMYSRMLPGSLNRAVWITSPDTFPELATMALNVGTGGSAIWLNNGTQGPPMTILGRPVIVSEKVGKLGDVGDIAFVDLGFYLIGDRQVMSSVSSPHYKFGNDMTAFRITQRVDGRPWIQSPITPKNGGPQMSPFVLLDERA